MDAAATPAVIGPNRLLYVVDDHHTLCALDYSEYSDVTVTLNVICDLSSLPVPEFWSTLSEKNLAFLYATPADKPDAFPLPMHYEEMPITFSCAKGVTRFTDAPWRAMAGFSRKVLEAPSPAPKCSDQDYKYCERCMMRGCGDGSQSSGPSVSFFEFRWAYDFVDAVIHNSSWWPTRNEHTHFETLYKSLGKSTLGNVDVAAWISAAPHIIPLCRGTATGSYPLPSMFVGTVSLPGFVEGYEKLDADPTCDSPVC